MLGVSETLLALQHIACEPPAAFEDELRSPVARDDLAAALLELAELPQCGVLHLAGPEPVSRLEFAQLIAARHGADPTRLRSARSAGQAVRRPLDCVLDSCELGVEKPGEGFFEAELYSLPPENFYLEAIEFEDDELAAHYRRAHEEYLVEREAIAHVPEIDGITAGGMPTRVKCLHVLVGHSLAKGPGVNPLGDEALELLGEWWVGNACGEAAAPLTT